MDLLRHGEELVAAVHHLPLGVDADAAEQRHMGGEQLGDAAAVRGCVDVEDPLAGEWPAELADAFERFGPDDVQVVVELLFQQRDAFEHAGLSGWCDPGPVASRPIYSACMRLSLAPDKFRGSLTGREAAAAMAAGLRTAGFDDVRTLAAGRRRRRHTRRVAGGAWRLAPHPST